MVEALPNPLVHPDIRTDLALPIHQEPEAKLRDRRKIIAAAENDRDLQLMLIAESRRSISFFAEWFVSTFQQTEIDASGKQTAYKGEASMQPWETWPIHERLHEKLEWCLREGQPLIIAKSRDMRVTWWLLIETAWHFVFEKRLFTSLLMSRLQDLVDSKDPDSLFYRLDYILNRLPWWMYCWDEKTFCNFTQTFTRSSIDGSATTESGGVGGRKDMIIVDEAARHPRLQELWDATRDTCQCRIANSTPKGPGPFKDLYQSGLPVFTAMYYHHPLKGRGAEWRTDETGLYTRQKGKRYIWTPWLEHEIVVGKRSAQDVAENIMMDFDVAAGQVFDGDVLARLRSAAAENPPSLHGVLVHKKDGHERDISLAAGSVTDIRFESRGDGRGQLTMWVDLVDGRPPADRAWCIFADVSNGVSSSNSVAAIGDANTGEKLGMWVSSTTDPSEFARVLAMLGLWLRGTSGPAMIGWESNGGQGQIVTEHLVKRLKYPRCFRDAEKGEFGWHNTKERKAMFIESLRVAMGRNEFLELDEQTLIEAGDYIWTPSGTPEPVKLREDREARGTHGDRVIATAGLWLVMQRQGVPKVAETLPESQSVAARFAKFKASRKPKASVKW
jgi:hypothetical protein